MLVSLSAGTIKRLLLPLSMSTMLCSLARTRLKSTPRRNSSLTNGNAVTWEKSRSFYACISHIIGTCPDIAFAVTKLAQFSANPSQEHFEQTKYICRYLVGTKNYSLVFKHAPGKGLAAYMDSDWASDPITRRSVTGYFFN
jgi:hypothetical protein